jgi:hypothetical protein
MRIRSHMRCHAAERSSAVRRQLGQRPRKMYLATKFASEGTSIYSARRRYLPVTARERNRRVKLEFASETRSDGP